MTTPQNRPYFQERLLSIAGYYSPPVVLDVLGYWLPPFSRISSRYVVINQRKWELWSPNSALTPFYPGLQDGTFTVNPDLPERLRRCDGHLGRFDPTVSPQIFDANQPWLPFVRQRADPAVYAEFSPFLSIWDEEYSAIIDDAYDALLLRASTIRKQMDSCQRSASSHPDLWASRPRPPEEADIRTLGSLRDFGEALDLHAHICRQAKLASAWVRMVRALAAHPRGAKHTITEVRDADDSLMGAWINGTTEEDGRWLLKLRVPSYVIHELDSESDWFHGAYGGYLKSFVTGTPVFAMGPGANPLDIAVAHNGGKLTDVPDDLWIASAPLPSFWGERLRSSPYGQGWSSEGYKYPGSTSLTPFEEREGYIIPPPVASDSIGTGSWTTWEEDRDERGNYCFTKVSKNMAKGISGKAWYDRENRRVLVFDCKPRTPRFYQAEVALFGLPAPQVIYREEAGGNQWKELPVSNWMYKNRSASRGDGGKIFQPPRQDKDNGYGSPMDDVCYANPYDQLPAAQRREQSPAPSPRRSEHDIPGQRAHCERPRTPSPDVSRRREYSPVLSPRRREPYVPNQRVRPARQRTPSPVLSRRPRGLRRHSSRHWSPPRAAELRRLRSRSPLPRRRYTPRSRSRSSDIARTRRLPSEELVPRGRRGRSRSSLRGNVAEGTTRYSRRLPSLSPPPESGHWPATTGHSSRDSRSLTRSPSRSRSPERRRRSPSSRRSSGSNSSDEVEIPATAMTIRSKARQPLDQRRVRALFAESPLPSFPILLNVERGGQSSVLAVSNLPLYFLWIDVLTWLRSVLSLVSRPRIDRVLRTLEGGYQVFWIKMRTPTDAATLRGLLSGRRVADSPFLRVDFVPGNVYSARCSVFRDAWCPAYGMEIENRPFRLNRPTLADRLEFAPLERRPPSAPPVVDPYPSADFLVDLLDRLPSPDRGQPVASSSTSLADRLEPLDDSEPEEVPSQPRKKRARRPRKK